MGSKSSPPPAPDYTAAANAQGQANLTSALQSGILSNPNVNSPYGSQSVSYAPVNQNFGGGPSMAPPPMPAPVSNPSPYGGADVNNGFMPQGPVSGSDTRFTQGGGGTGLTPTQSFQSNSPGIQGMVQPTVTQTLNPQSQAIFNAQQGTKLGLANLSGQALNTAQNIMGTPFQYQGPGMQMSLGNYGPIQTSVANAGDINKGPAADQYGLAGGISAGQYGLANGQLDLSNVAKMPVNAGQTGQQAIMARLQPQIQQGDQAYAAQLANQGIAYGSQAFDNAMRVHNQSNNDLLSQAALQGIGLDLTTNQQGFGQALQRGQFGNQAVAQNFGQGLAAQQLSNQAIGQNFGQGAASAQLQNQAQQQQYGQNLNNAQFANQAQNQMFNQGLARGQFGNTAQQQALQQQLYQRELPLNEISALMSGSQIQNPQFQPYTGSSVAPAPLFNAAQAQYNAGLQNYGMNNAANNNFMGGLFGLGGAGLQAAGAAGGFGPLLGF